MTNLGYIGLGKMGFNMVERMLERGYGVVAYNRNSERTKEIEKKGAISSYTLEELVSSLRVPRTIWIMVAHQAVDDVLDELVPLLGVGDTVIDGGNSRFTLSVERSKRLGERGIDFMDVGVSGGPSGARNGACLMIGGKREKYNEYEELFKDLSVKEGYGYMGAAGSGHFVKMVHNGIEYGMMQAIGEGFEVMKKSDFDINLSEVARVYNRGSVIESRLVGWLVSAYEKYGKDLSRVSGEVSQSGEGQWTVETAREFNVPVQVIEDALEFRKDSQGNPSYTGRVVSALRNQFGGHDVSTNI